MSAFCNAGFSTLPGNLYDPLIRHIYGLQVILAFLIIFGGIGFPILFNYVRLFHYWIRNNIKCLLGLRYKVEHQPRIVSTTTRIVLPATLVLLVVGESQHVGRNVGNRKICHGFHGCGNSPYGRIQQRGYVYPAYLDHFPDDRIDVDRGGAYVNRWWYQGDDFRDCPEEYLGAS